MLISETEDEDEALKRVEATLTSAGLLSDGVSGHKCAIDDEGLSVGVERLHFPCVVW